MALFQKSKSFVNDEKRFHDVFEQSAIGESMVDLQGRWIEVNERLCKITGYSKKELIGKKFADITYKDDVEKSLNSMRDLLSGKIQYINLEKRYVQKNGNIIWVLLSIALFKNGDNKPHYFIVHTQDINNFKKTEQQLRDLEEKYSAIVENGSDGIIIVQDGLIKFCNGKVKELTGYSIDEIVEKSFLFLIGSDYKERIKRNYESRMAGGKTEQRYRIELIKKNDGTIPFEISGYIINYEGRPADMVFMRDISDLLKKEKEEKTRVEQIEKINKLAVGRELRMVELKKEIDELKKKYQSKR